MCIYVFPLMASTIEELFIQSHKVLLQSQLNKVASNLNETQTHKAFSFSLFIIVSTLVTKAAGSSIVLTVHLYAVERLLTLVAGITSFTGSSILVLQHEQALWHDSSKVEKFIVVFGASRAKQARDAPTSHLECQLELLMQPLHDLRLQLRYPQLYSFC